LNRQSTTSVHLNAYARPSIWPLGYLHRSKQLRLKRCLALSPASSVSV